MRVRRLMCFRCLLDRGWGMFPGWFILFLCRKVWWLVSGWLWTVWWRNGFLFPDQAERVKGTLGGMWESLGSSYRVVSGVAAELGSVVEGLVVAANRVERESMVGGSGELGDVLGSAKDRVEGVLGVLSGWSFRGVTVWEGPVSEVTGLLDDQFGRLEVSVRVESERERERARVLRQMLRYPC